MKIRSKNDLDALGKDGWALLNPPRATSLFIGTASCGIAAGADTIASALHAFASAAPEETLNVVQTGCIGFCQMEPLVEVRIPEGERLLYGPILPERLPELLEAWKQGHFPEKGRIALLPPLPSAPPSTRELIGCVPDHPFYKGQIRIASRNCGQIDPENILHAIALGAYRGAVRALTEMTPEAVIEEIRASGLRGRGGAGYPTGKKWELSRKAPGAVRYVICNADEGDPGAYMDRSLLESDPHAVLEGMLIGAYATGARYGLIYVRMEYPLAIQRLRHAIEEARRRGLLGERILGSSFDFDVDLVEGAGAFVSGEETALIAAIEGRIAEPRPRPPYPAVQGLYGAPTVINNVETWANVPAILENGGSWFAALGTAQSKGTKVFSLVGAVQNTGLVEVPMGTSLQSIVEEIGGGARTGRTLKAVQTGGPSGGCIPADRFHLPVDYESLAAQGSIMGSGGMVVLDSDSCIVDLARYFLDFTRNESCGKCTPCREGLERMHEILEQICSGNGTAEDLERLLDLAEGVRDASLCGLGKSAPNPVLTTLRDFRDEYEAHVLEKRCPAGVCKPLIGFAIDPAACVGCGACVRVCPAGALSGEKEEPHVLDAQKCIKCGACREICRFEAVRVVSGSTRD